VVEAAAGAALFAAAALALRIAQAPERLAAGRFVPAQAAEPIVVPLRELAAGPELALMRIVRAAELVAVRELEQRLEPAEWVAAQIPPELVVARELVAAVAQEPVRGRQEDWHWAV
jgi:hypothetical protein